MSENFIPSGTPNIFLATPMYGGQCYGPYAQSVFDLHLACMRRQWILNFSYLYGDALITRARNTLTYLFMNQNFTHLLFIDADIKFNPEEILAMVEADVDVICGIYPKKKINWQSVSRAAKNGIAPENLKEYAGEFVLNLVDYAETTQVQYDKPFEIMTGGTGCMLIKKEVFEKLSKVTPSYQRDPDNPVGRPDWPNKIYNFFNVSVCPKTNRMLSEDWHFCLEWRKIGGKIYGAPWVKLTHVGANFFEGNILLTQTGE